MARTDESGNKNEFIDRTEFWKETWFQQVVEQPLFAAYLIGRLLNVIEWMLIADVFSDVSDRAEKTERAIGRIFEAVPFIVDDSQVAEEWVESLRRHFEERIPAEQRDALLTNSFDNPPLPTQLESWCEAKNRLAEISSKFVTESCLAVARLGIVVDQGFRPFVAEKQSDWSKSFSVVISEKTLLAPVWFGRLQMATAALGIHERLQPLDERYHKIEFVEMFDEKIWQALTELFEIDNQSSSLEDPAEESIAKVAAVISGNPTMTRDAIQKKLRDAHGHGFSNQQLGRILDILRERDTYKAPKRRRRI